MGKGCQGRQEAIKRFNTILRRTQLLSYRVALGVNNDRTLVDEADDAYFARALRADKRICFVHLADEVRPAPL